MGRALHHRKKDDKYALWSTIVDDYVTEWKSKEEIKKEWINELTDEAISKVNRWVEEIDKEI